MATVRSVSVSGGGGSAGGTAPRTATMFACVTTLSNTLLGVSVVGVAGGFARAGWLIGTFYLMVFAFLAGSGLHLLARSSMTVSALAKRREDAREEAEGEGGGGGKGRTRCIPPSSFRAVALVGAPRWAFLIDLAVALKCFGVATSYLVVVGDLMPTAMADILGRSYPDSVLRDRHVWVTIGFLLAAPLAFSRTLGALKYTATLAIGLVVFLAGMVMSFLVVPGLDACPPDETVANALDEPGTAVEGVAVATGGENSSRGLQLLASSARGMMSSSQAGAGIMEDMPGFASAGGDFDFGGGDEDGGSCFEGSNVLGSVRTILQTLPIFVFCFTCHQNIFTICNEIVRPTPARVDTVIACSMLVAIAIYMSIAWGAYATFGVGVDGDLLTTYPRTGLLTTARICVSMLVTSCYPLQAHPSRVCILSTWKAFSLDMEEAYSSLATDDGAGTEKYTAEDSISPSLRRHRNASGPPEAPLSSNGSVVADSNTAASPNSLGCRDGGASPSSEPGQRGKRRLLGGGEVVGGLTSAAQGGVGGDVDNTRFGEDARRGTAEVEARFLGVNDREQRGELLSEGAHAAAAAAAAPDEEAGLERGGGEHVGWRQHHLQGDAADIEAAGRGRAFPRTVCSARQAAGEGEGEAAFWTSPDGFRHIVVTAAFLALSYTIAMAVNDLGVILEVVGATGSTTVAFVLPGLLYLKLHPEPHPKRSLATLQLAVGLLIIPVALTFIALGHSAEG
ncbi:unnamed protein product [Ectocarpus sp. 4 AP-2014]